MNTYVTTLNREQTAIDSPYVMGMGHEIVSSIGVTLFVFQICFGFPSKRPFPSAYSAVLDQWFYPIYPPGSAPFLPLSLFLSCIFSLICTPD